MEDIITMLSAAAQLKQLKLYLEYEEAVPENLIADDKIFQQILINLIGNAIKFTEEGYIKVIVKCVSKLKKSVKLQIAVEDTGIGIPPDKQQAVFRRFYQLENAYTRNESLTGTGLGLAIVKKLVNLLNSKIQVDSIPNKGSTFYFNVKLPIAPETAPQQLIKPLPKVERNLTNPYVLLIEDDALIQIIHKQMLEELNCRVDVTDCAVKALKMVKKDYDILFVDIGLPDMSGFELIKKIRNKNSKMKEVSIVVLTGYSDENESKRCMEAGANQVAIKPVTLETLKKIIQMS